MIEPTSECLFYEYSNCQGVFAKTDIVHYLLLNLGIYRYEI